MKTFRWTGRGYMAYGFIYLLIAGLMVANGGFTASRLLLLVPLPIIWAISTLLLRESVTLTDNGIKQYRHFQTKEIGWGEFTSIKYKPGGSMKGYEYADKILLTSPNGTIALNSHYKHWDVLEQQVAEALQEQGQLDYEATKAKVTEGAWVVHPHVQDLPELLLSLGWLVASLMVWMPWVLRL